MNETTMTVVGNVVDTPTLRRTGNGHWVANFRVASTTRRFDREQGRWTDASTLFVTVTAWRAMAENIAQSLFKGQPVVVTGRYYQREYEKDEQLRTTYELEAMAVGHDLSRGVSAFEKRMRPQVAPVQLDADGLPEDASDDIYRDATVVSPSAGGTGQAGLDGGLDVDLDTGEVRELATAG